MFVFYYELELVCLIVYNWTRPRSLLGVILKPSAVLGAAVGADVGVVGPAVGLAVGLAVVGFLVGDLVGTFVGALVGFFVGDLVGFFVGCPLPHMKFLNWLAAVCHECEFVGWLHRA